MSERQPAVYILASGRNGTLYVGVTSNLIRRVYEHKHDMAKGFTSRYSVHTLVYYELHGSMYQAITREKGLKNWSRQEKLRLIEESNEGWLDLWDEIAQG